MATSNYYIYVVCVFVKVSEQTFIITKIALLFLKLIHNQLPNSVRIKQYVFVLNGSFLYYRDFQSFVRIE